MAEALEGLFSGIGQGMAQAGQMGAKDYFQKSRLKLRQKLNAEAKAEDREFQKEQSQTQHKRQKELAEYQQKLSSENQANWEDVTDEQGNVVGQRNADTNKYVPYKESGNKDFGPKTQETLDRVEVELKDLYQRRRAIEKNVNEMGDPLMSGEEQAAKLEKINEAIEANQANWNRIVGNKKPSDGSGFERALNMADQVPEKDRDEYIDDLKADGNPPDYVIEAIRNKWRIQDIGKDDDAGANGQSDTQGSQGGSSGDQRPERSQSSTERPGLFEILNQAQEGLDKDQASTQEQSGGQKGSRTGRGIGGSGGDNVINRGVGKAIDTVVNYPSEARKRMAQDAIQEMERIAVKGPPKTEREENRFFLDYAPYINQAPPEIRQQIIEIFGEEKLKPYLEKG